MDRIAAKAGSLSCSLLEAAGAYRLVDAVDCLRKPTTIRYFSLFAIVFLALAAISAKMQTPEKKGDGEP